MADLENNSVSINPQDFNYTPTPWKARDYPNKEDGYWIDCDSWEHKGRGGCRGGTLATAHDTGTGEGNAKANSLRITACVNACEGISNEALENGVINDLIYALKLQMHWTMRDGTPCSCPAGENEDDEFTRPKKMPTMHASGCSDARAALAKLKSGQLPERKIAKGDRVILSRVRHAEYKGQVGEVVKIVKSRNQVSVRLESGVLYDANPENIDRHPA